MWLAQMNPSPVWEKNQRSLWCSDDEMIAHMGEEPGMTFSLALKPSDTKALYAKELK